MRGVLACCLLSSLALADEPRLALFAGAGFLGNFQGHGSVVSGGVRVRLVPHLVAGFDAGYGFVSLAQGVQDRWWLMPSLGLTATAGPARFEVGGGLGLGTASQFASWRDYGADKTVWAMQLVPAVRGSASVAFGISEKAEIFLRAEVGLLLAESTSIGIREGTAASGIGATSWVLLSVGVQLDVL